MAVALCGTDQRNSLSIYRQNLRNRWTLANPSQIEIQYESYLMLHRLYFEQFCHMNKHNQSVDDIQQKC